jgi:hypothetical protein
VSGETVAIGHGSLVYCLKFPVFFRINGGAGVVVHLREFGRRFERETGKEECEPQRAPRARRKKGGNYPSSQQVSHGGKGSPGGLFRNATHTAAVLFVCNSPLLLCGNAMHETRSPFFSASSVPAAVHMLPSPSPFQTSAPFFNTPSTSAPRQKGLSLRF